MHQCTQKIKVQGNSRLQSNGRKAPLTERHEAWLEDHRYLNMDLLKEHKKETLRQAA